MLARHIQHSLDDARPLINEVPLSHLTHLIGLVSALSRESHYIATEKLRGLIVLQVYSP